MGLFETCIAFTQHQFFREIAIAILLGAVYLFYYLRFSRPHFLIKGVYDVKRKNLRKPPPPFPNGWYNVAATEEIPREGVKAIDINGHNIVLFRGDKNQLYALQGYCLHMGAHLGIGGQVKNKNCIECPFHGWMYNGATGQCVDNDGKPLKLKSIQYNQDIGKKDCKLEWKNYEPEIPTLKKYPVVQMNGYIYIWIHAMEEYSSQPEYPMLDVSKFKDHLVYRGKTQHHINCHLQDIPSNGADTLHFKYVHTYLIPQVKSLYFRWQANWKAGDDPSVKDLFEHSNKEFREWKQKIYRELIEPYPRKEVLSIGNLQNWLHLPLLGQKYLFTATIIQVGMGIVFVILKSHFYELVFHHYIRPVAPNQQHVFHDCFISWHVPYFVAAKISQGEGGQVTNDMFIWESKSFARKAFLKQNESDGLMEGWLKWSSQFYQGCGNQQQKEGLAF